MMNRSINIWLLITTAAAAVIALAGCAPSEPSMIAYVPAGAMLVAPPGSTVGARIDKEERFGTVEGGAATLGVGEASALIPLSELPEAWRPRQ